MVSDIKACYDKDPTVEKSEDLFEYVRNAVPKTPAIGLSTVILAKLSQMEAVDGVNV